MTRADVIARLRADIAAHGTQAAWATAHGFSAQYVGDVLKGRREVSTRLAAALGVARVVSWEAATDEGGG